MESKIKEEFIKEYLEEPMDLGRSELEDIANWWLTILAEQRSELLEKIKLEKKPSEYADKNGKTFIEVQAYNQAVSDLESLKESLE